MNKIIKQENGNKVWKVITENHYLSAKELSEQYQNKEKAREFIEFVYESNLLEMNLKTSEDYEHPHNWECLWTFGCKDKLIEIRQGGNKHYEGTQTPFGGASSIGSENELAEFVELMLMSFDKMWEEGNDNKSA